MSSPIMIIYLFRTTFANFNSSSLNHMLMITGTDKKQSKIIVNTNQAFQVIVMAMIMMDKKLSKPDI